MIAAVADILKSKLAALDWVDRFGGLVNIATRPVFVTGADGAQVVTGYQSYPVACTVNAANCWENGLYKHFEPDSRKTAILFFMDNGGVNLKSVEGPKNARIKFSFDLRLLGWLNIPALGPELTTQECNIAGRLVPYVMAQLWGLHDAFGKLEGGPEEKMFQDVEVTNLRQLTKSPSLFQPFTFATDGNTRGLFLYPYDYFGIGISGTFIINTKCLPPLFFSPDSAYCLPGTATT